MLYASLLMLAQVETRGNIPSHLLPVILILLIGGALGWVIAAVLGFQRASAFGPSARWFAYCAVCLIIYHLQWLVLAFFSNDADMALNVGPFFNLFVVLASVCAILGFVKLTNPR
jgi:hypothetical protein